MVVKHGTNLQLTFGFDVSPDHVSKPYISIKTSHAQESPDRYIGGP